MNSAFFEFNVAVSGLYAAKNGLSVTSNNVSNASTKGYSRQIAMQKAARPLPGVNGVGMIGTGSDVYGISQVRDFYLDKKYWTQESTSNEYSTKNDQLSIVESVFNELSTSGGLSASLDDFFESLSGLTFDATDGTYRTSVVNFASSFTKNINSFAQSLLSQQQDLNEEIHTIVDKINSISDQIVSLNEQIFYQEIDGSNANDLRDQRALLIDELAQYTNIDVTETETEHGDKLTILINGQTLVNHFDNQKLKCVERDTKRDDDDAPYLYDIQWKSGNTFSLEGLTGQLKGLLDIRDGNDGNNGSMQYKGIPYYIDKLNTLSQTLARAFNEGKHLDGTAIDGLTGHIDGYDAKGNQGNLFFSYKVDGKTVEDTEIDYSKITAFNFSVSDELLNDSSRLAASTTLPTDGESNNEVILGFIGIKDNDSLFKQGNVYDYVNGASTELGIDKKQSEKFSSFYEDLVSTTSNQRTSVSGVSLNEEMAYMIKYQQLYQAASQLINAINKIYDTTINGLGI